MQIKSIKNWIDQCVNFEIDEMEFNNVIKFSKKNVQLVMLVILDLLAPRKKESSIKIVHALLIIMDQTQLLLKDDIIDVYNQ